MKTKQENIILDSQGPFSKIWSTQLKRYFKPIEKKKKTRLFLRKKTFISNYTWSPFNP